MRLILVSLLMLFAAAGAWAQDTTAARKSNIKGLQQVKPLYIIKMDNREFQAWIQPTEDLDIKLIPVEHIQQVQVFKDQKAIDQYGPSARNGAVVLTLKEVNLELLPLWLRTRFK